MKTSFTATALAIAIALAATVPAYAQMRIAPLRPAGPGAPQPASVAPSPELEHQQIIALLASLTSQVTALSQQVAQTQDALKALQITVNLTMTSTDKGRVAAINDGDAVANLQTSVNGLSNSVSQLQSKISALQSNAAATQANLASMQSNAAASQALQADMARRLYMTCYMVAYDFVGAGGSHPYDKTSCTSGGWNASQFNFDTPFTTVNTVAPAVGGAAEPPKH